MPARRFRFHLIANAHLDPVWLWDWREGFNEAVNTTRAMLGLLDEFPELTVVRGESALYAFVEREAPETFARVCAQVAAGRWEPVGGTYIQSDNNLPATATLLRQFETGQAYFESRFGRRTDTAWFPDSFGHSAGLPDILTASGIANFAHCRPFPAQLPLAQPAYWWEGAGGARILAYRSPVEWYCHERHTLIERLDAYRREAERFDLENIAVFYGLGNHGGGPTRRMLRELRHWGSAHPEVELIHSGLSRYFREVRAELDRRPGFELPVFRGELGFCLRGCYVSTAKIKIPFRRAEQALLRAEKVAALALSAGGRVDCAPLTPAWEAVLFNSFHDILPGSSIERAYDDQIAQLGGASDAAQHVEFAALNSLARTLDTSVPEATDDQPGAVPFLILNPHPAAYCGPVEIEAQLDWRPIRGYGGARTADVPIEVRGPDGRPRGFQRIGPENRAMTDLVWRVRLVVPVDLPAGGWEVLTVQYRESPDLAAPQPRLESPVPHSIGNGEVTVTAVPGAAGLQLAVQGRKLLADEGLGVCVFDDPYGSWGGLLEEPDSWHMRNVREIWRVEATRVLECGPLLARLWVRLAGARSRLDLTISLFRGDQGIHLAGRLFLNERSARVKLMLPGLGAGAVFEVPGGQVERGAGGEVSGIGWVRAAGPGGAVAFLSDTFSGFSLTDGALTVSLARASRYADDVPTDAAAEPQLAVVDSGELRFRALLTPQTDRVATLALHLRQPVIALCVPAARGAGARAGALHYGAGPLTVLAVRPLNAEEVELTVQNDGATVARPEVCWRGEIVTGPALRPGEITRWRWPFAAKQENAGPRNTGLVVLKTKTT